MPKPVDSIRPTLIKHKGKLYKVSYQISQETLAYFYNIEKKKLRKRNIITTLLEVGGIIVLFILFQYFDLFGKIVTLFSNLSQYF